MEKLKLLLVSAVGCIVLGLACSAYAYFSGQDLQYESGQWYQSVHVDESKNLNVSIQWNDISFVLLRKYIYTCTLCVFSLQCSGRVRMTNARESLWTTEEFIISGKRIVF